MNCKIYTLTSELHDERAVNKSTQEFLQRLNLDFDFKGSDYDDYGTAPLSLIYVRTGGTEGIFNRLLPQLQQKSAQPFYLLTSGKSNSLAASMEILSFLRQRNLDGEIIHGSPEYVTRRIGELQKVGEARKLLNGCRLGIIGQPSDWLISSHAAPQVVREKVGIELVEIDMSELLETVGQDVDGGEAGAMKIYEALKLIVSRYNLQGFTLRCFDLLSAVRNTGCLALAKLNSEGIVAGCEGDVPAMLTMKIAQALTGIIGFQANPASIDVETGQMVFAHCTIPLSLVERYEFDTHFESGIGIGIRGYMKEGPVTVFKVSGDLSRHFVSQGWLIRNEAKPDLCRTQQVIRLDDASQAAYFLTRPIGNHHIILPGHLKSLIESLVGNW